MKGIKFKTFSNYSQTCFCFRSCLVPSFLLPQYCPRSFPMWRHQEVTQQFPPFPSCSHFRIWFFLKKLQWRSHIFYCFLCKKKSILRFFFWRRAFAGDIIHRFPTIHFPSAGKIRLIKLAFLISNWNYPASQINRRDSRCCARMIFQRTPLVAWFYSSMVLLFYSSMVLWFYSSMVL